MGLQSRGQLSGWVSKTEAGPFNRLAKGIETPDNAKNPQTQEYTWIDDGSDSNTSGYQESFSVSGFLYEGDPASEMLHEMVWTNAKNDDATIYYCIVRGWKEGSSEGTYDAKLLTISFAPENEGGGTGGDNVTFSGTMNVKGDPVSGTFDMDTKTFTAA